MTWASRHIEQLMQGATVDFFPRGSSMHPLIASGQLVTVEPLAKVELNRGDIVLCKVKGNQYLHLIKAIQGERYQIGNNNGRINGWIGRTQIYGKCTKIHL
tara:strand:+ start:347 stop:649 length:303 start_codon:yes stop_codon:yes gene_type:complete